MSYTLEEWDYTDAEAINKVVEYFKKHRRLVVLVDNKKDESFIIVGDSSNREKDIRQGQVLLNVVNDPTFPTE